MIILNYNSLLGDSLSTLPAIWQLAQTNRVYLATILPEVTAIIPDNPNITHIHTIQDISAIADLDQERICILDASKNFHEFCSHATHMVQGYFKYAGLPIPTDFPTLPLNLETDDTIEPYDFLISAGSRSDHMNNKLWPYDRWQQVIDYLTAQGYRVAVLISARPEEHIFTGVDHIKGQPLKKVGGYIKTVKKAVLSIDNGISHFTRLIGSPHILLYPACLPETWVGNPKASTIQSNPLNLTVDEVINLIRVLV